MGQKKSITPYVVAVENLRKGKVYPVGTVRLHGKKYKRKTTHGWVEVPKRELRDASGKKGGRAFSQKVKILGSGRGSKEDSKPSGVAARGGGAVEDIKAKYAKKYARVLSGDMGKRGLHPAVNQVKTEDGPETRVEFGGAFAIVDFKGDVTLPEDQSKVLAGKDSDAVKKFNEARKEYEKDPDRKDVDREREEEMSSLAKVAEEGSVEKGSLNMVIGVAGKSQNGERGEALFYSLLREKMEEWYDKGRTAVPIGTRKTRADGRTYIKVAAGKWALAPEVKKKRGRKKGAKAKPHHKKPGPKRKPISSIKNKANADVHRIGRLIGATEGAKLLGISVEKFREYATKDSKGKHTGPKVPEKLVPKVVALLKMAKFNEKREDRGAPMTDDPQSEKVGLRWFKRSKSVFSDIIKAMPEGPGWEKVPHPRTGKMGFRRKKAGGGYEYYYPDSAARSAAKKIKDSGHRSGFRRPGKAKDDKAGAKFKGTPKNREQVLEKYGHLGVMDPPPEKANFKKIQFEDIDPEDHASKYCYKWKDMTRGKKDPKTGKPKGKWKYGYSAEYKRCSGREKFDRIVKVLEVLEEARTVFSDDTGNKKLSDKDRSTACALSLMAMTGIRKGGMEHFEEFGTRGALTIAAKNIKIKGDVVSLDFVGKKKQQNIFTIEDRNVAQYMKQKMKGKSGDDMLWPEVKEKDLEVMKQKHGFGKSIKNHDFRTANATLYAAEAFAALQGPPPPLPKGDKKQTKLLLSKITEVSTIVSDKLNNSPAAAEESYIHPAVIYGWLTTAVGEEKARTFFGKAKGMEGLTKNKKAALILEKMMSLKMPGKRSWGWTKEDENIIEPDQMDSYLLPESLL